MLFYPSVVYMLSVGNSFKLVVHRFCPFYVPVFRESISYFGKIVAFWTILEMLYAWEYNLVTYTWRRSSPYIYKENFLKLDGTNALRVIFVNLSVESRIQNFSTFIISPDSPLVNTSTLIWAKAIVLKLLQHSWGDGHFSLIAEARGTDVTRSISERICRIPRNFSVRI